MNSDATPVSVRSTGTTTIAITSQRVANGLNQPLYVTAPPGDTQRLFIVEQNSGAIKILDLTTGTVLATPFLTIPSGDLLNNGNEQGLLGLAFHPNYAQNGKFYVNYTAPGGGAAGQTRVVEYTVQSGNPNQANAATARTVLTINQPFSNHNGGWLAFGPDGYLYVATGDGGGTGDPNNNAQTITNNLLGKILRLDVNGDAFPADPARNYAIPASNPFVGQTGDDEIWVYGVRNPWRPSFDRLTGDLYIADVGQNQREEINVQLASSPGGGNYGWNWREGTLPYRPGTPPAGLIDPIYEYGRSVGQSITGGYVYRGGVVEVGGTYFFGDFVAGRIWSFRYQNGTVQEFTDRTTQLTPNVGSIDNIASFGEDAAGNLYVVDLDGEIFRISVTKTITGSAEDDLLTGNASTETILGLAGNDQLVGGGGRDTLSGGDGADRMDGGNGFDILQGGLGNDVYLNPSGDWVVENLGAGSDTVLSSSSYGLSDFIERLTLTGGAAIEGTGNQRNNVLRGNGAANVLRGQGGNDRLLGLQGDDVLIGSTGNDTLTGGRGNQSRDRFIFDINRPFNLAQMGFDLVTDFTPGQDRILLDRTTFQALTTLSFATVANAAQAGTSAALITYVRGSGNLFYNPNGSAPGFGGGGRFADVTNGLQLTRADFALRA